MVSDILATRMSHKDELTASLASLLTLRLHCMSNFLWFQALKSFSSLKMVWWPLYIVLSRRLNDHFCTKCLNTGFRSWCHFECTYSSPNLKSSPWVFQVFIPKTSVCVCEGNSVSLTNFQNLGMDAKGSALAFLLSTSLKLQWREAFMVRPILNSRDGKQITFIKREIDCDWKYPYTWWIYYTAFSHSHCKNIFWCSVYYM